MVFPQTSFPRGGISKPSKPSFSKTQNIEFGAKIHRRKKEKLNKKQRDEKRKLENQANENNIEARSADLLNLKTIQEGMTIMGCISSISPTYLSVSLPGRITGQILITSISKAYLNIINKYVNDTDNAQGYKDLDEMFTVGQIVCVKVMKIDINNKMREGKIKLSMNPSDIQSEFYHQNITKGMILCVAVEEMQEHGYIVDTGIKNLRGFLPLANASPNLSIGQVIFCKVYHANLESSASTVILKTIDTNSRKLKNMEEPNLSYMLPSTIVKFKVVKYLKGGIQGTIMDDIFTGYINEHQLSLPTSSPMDYEIDSVHNARILCVMPITKLIYLSLNLNESIPINSEDVLKIGTIIEKAKVIGTGTGGVIIKLNKKFKGIISVKSLTVGLNINYNTEEIMARYHTNSYHKVRIIRYEPMDAVYICSAEHKIINEQNYSIDDVDIGDYVDANIKLKLEDGAYFIRVGNIKGYIEKIQIAATTPSSKLVRNAKLRCRVLRKSVKDNKIFLTNRKELMAEKTVLLKSHEEAVVGNDYHGMICKIYPNGYLVSFCNYMKGMLFKKDLNEIDAMTASYFYEGQILKFRIISASDENNIKLCLGDFKCQTGTILSGTVTTIQQSGLHIAFANSKFNGFVPNMLLSNFPNLLQSIHETYQPNDTIRAVCITNNVYSIRNVDDIVENPIKHWNDIQVGDIVSTFVKNVAGEIIDLLCFIGGHSTIMKIHTKMLLEDYKKITYINLVAEQMLHVKVLGKNNFMNNLTCSARLSDVWNGDLNDTAKILSNYFKDLQRIKMCGQKNNNFIAFHNIGDIITGIIENIVDEDNNNKIFVKLPHDIPGVITSTHCSKDKPEIGTEVQCLIIWIDYTNNIVYLSMNTMFLERKQLKDYNDIPKSVLQSADGLKADVMLILDDLIILYPRKVTNDFIYVPTRFHYNDLQPIISDGINEGDICNVTTISTDGEYVIGMFENIYAKFKKLKRTLKRKHIEIKKEKNKKIRLNTINEFNKKPAIAYYNTNIKKVRLNSVDESDKKPNIADIGNISTNDTFFYTDTQGSHIKKESISNCNEINSNHNKIKTENSDEITKTHKNQLNYYPKYSLKMSQLDGAADVLSDDSDNISEDELDHSLITKQKSKRKLSNIKEIKKPILLGKKHKFENTKEFVKLPSISNFWSSDLKVLDKEEYSGSSSEDEVCINKIPTKKQHLTSKERFRAARDEEARVRQIEEDYANIDSEPTTVDHFERLVLASPNSSLTWINYMVFHLQSNEIEKARAVARKALKKISFRDEPELFNVWIALLNLELRYGNKELFDSVLNESLILNDPFKIYSKCLKMLADVKKVQELCDMVLTFTKKFRSKSECWSIAATAYFDVDLTEKAQQLLNRALATLPERDHINTIVKFANLNNKYNQKNTAHALLEQILTSYPKRVDCWSQYIDMLVKDNEVDLARQTLERAVSQKIPIKKMRTLFKKYLEFEEKYGNESNVMKVKAMASNYVEKQING